MRKIWGLGVGVSECGLRAVGVSGLGFSVHGVGTQTKESIPCFLVGVRVFLGCKEAIFGNL